MVGHLEQGVFRRAPHVGEPLRRHAVVQELVVRGIDEQGRFRLRRPRRVDVGRDDDLLDALADLDELRRAGLRMPLDLPPLRPGVRVVVVPGIAQQKTVIGFVDDQPDVSAHPHRPEVLVLRAIKLVKLMPRIRGVHLQVKRRCLHELLLVVRQPGEAAGERIGDAKIHCHTPKRRSRARLLTPPISPFTEPSSRFAICDIPRRDVDLLFSVVEVQVSATKSNHQRLDLSLVVVARDDVKGKIVQLESAGPFSGAQPIEDFPTADVPREPPSNRARCRRRDDPIRGRRRDFRPRAVSRKGASPQRAGQRCFTTGTPTRWHQAPVVDRPVVIMPNATFCVLSRKLFGLPLRHGHSTLNTFITSSPKVIDHLDCDAAAFGFVERARRVAV